MTLLEKRYSATATVQVREVDDELIVLDTEHNRFSGLDRVGACIWQSLTQGQSVGEAVTQLAERYPAVSRTTLEADATRLTSELCARGWLREQPTS